MWVYFSFEFFPWKIDREFVNEKPLSIHEPLLLYYNIVTKDRLLSPIAVCI